MSTIHQPLQCLKTLKSPKIVFVSQRWLEVIWMHMNNMNWYYFYCLSITTNVKWNDGDENYEMCETYVFLTHSEKIMHF